MEGAGPGGVEGAVGPCVEGCGCTEGLCQGSHPYVATLAQPRAQPVTVLPGSQAHQRSPQHTLVPPVHPFLAGD